MVHSVQKKINAPQRDENYEQAHVCLRQGIGKKRTNEQTKKKKNEQRNEANNKGRRRIDEEQNVENAYAIANERKK